MDTKHFQSFYLILKNFSDTNNEYLIVVFQVAIDF